MAEGGDLLDLSWEGPAGKGNESRGGDEGGHAAQTSATEQPSATGGSPAEAGHVAHAEAAAGPTTSPEGPEAHPPAAASTVPTAVKAAETPGLAEAGFLDDDWGGFQCAKDEQSPSQKRGTSSAVEASAAPVEEQVNFDPLSSGQAEAATPDLFSTSDLGQLGTKSGKDSGNLISFGVVDEFDPIRPFPQSASDGGTSSAPPSTVAATAAPAAAAAAGARETEEFARAVSAGAVPGAAGAAPPLATRPSAASAEDVQSYPAAMPDQSDLLGLGSAARDNSNIAIEDEFNDLPVQDIEKKLVYVYHKGEKNVVGWYADMRPADIREAVLCACDAIIDGGFVLREVQFTGEDETQAEPKEDGKVFEYEQFDVLENGQTYIIEPAQERDDLKNIVGDRWRRLKVHVEPLLHVEAQKAIERMRRGSNLLKHTHYGFPHLRQFQLSDDRKRLVWYSGAKRKEDSVVVLDEVTEIRLGQTTPVFLHYRLPMLEHLSFSLVYGPKGSSLDLTCKDEFEFDHWVTGLKAIFYHLKNRQISKEQLLGHSKRFRKALEKNNTGIKLTKLPEVKEKGHVGLDDCIEIVTHTPQQLDTKMDRLRERLRAMSQQVARLDHHSTAEMEVDLALLTGQGPAYASVFERDEDAQDEEMEIRRMHELVEQTTQILQQARNELIALYQRQKSEASSSANAEATSRGKKKDSASCKHIDQLLWKAEVDLENVEDMYLRHIDNQRDTVTAFSISIADMNTKLTQVASDAGEAWSRRLEEFRGMFSRP